MKAIRYTLTLVLFSIVTSVQAQSDSVKNKLSFRVGTYYNSYLNYYGRTDSLQSSGFFPMAELWWKNKFYLNAAPIFTYNSLNRFQYAGAVATLGYLKNNGKSSTHIYLLAPIYKDNSQLVQSALKAQLAGNFTELNKILNVTMGADIKVSNNIDYGANLGIDHLFRKQLPNQVILVLDPSVYVYAGTQRFTQTRYEKNGFLIFPGIDQQVTEDVSKFTVLSYEISMPVILAKGKWMFLATPAYVIPQNLLVIESQPGLSERGKKKFYVSAGIKLSL